MPRLRCSVRTCLHHSYDYCCMGAISVDGKRANTAQETNCNTFCDNNGQMTNAAIDMDPNIDVSITCAVTQCAYNHYSACTAPEIQVSGHYANDARQTECSSFIYR